MVKTKFTDQGTLSRHSDSHSVTGQPVNSTLDLTVPPGSETPRIAGRYEVFEQLGKGGMSTVFRARDHKSSQDVAVKFMKTDLGGSARRRFFREFNTIAGIDHPCCLKVFEIGETEQAPYFTMELHPGRPVTDILGESPKHLAPMLIDLTLAVDYIHSQGIVHRDIKPSNVLVERTGDREEQRITAKLADFGLAKFYQFDSSLTAERGMVGTPAYCAPEQIDGGRIDYRVDLYAIGVLAYELLSGGQHPFCIQRERGVSSLLNAHLSVIPERLENPDHSIPEPVAQTVAAYLAKDPEHRPDSAAALRRVLAENYGVPIEARLEQLSTPSAVRLNALGFVCRDAELRQAEEFLHNALDTTDLDASDGAAGSSTLLVISGEPGAGKTSIMREVSRRAVGKGCRVLEGRCFDGNHSPFQPFIEIIRQLFASLKRTQVASDESTLYVDSIDRRVNEAQQLERILLDYRLELLRVAPELRRWLPGQAVEPALRNDNDYILRALATMFIELGSVRPLCFCLDDIQWADQSTLALLQHLAAALGRQRLSGAASNDERAQLALVCTGRSGYEQVGQFVSQSSASSNMLEIELGTFDASESRQMLALRLGCLPTQIDPRLVDAIESLCHGNPFFISETVREWHTRGMIVRFTEGWQLVQQSQDDSSLPSTVRSALRSRLNELSKATQALVPVAAVLGRVVDLDLLDPLLPELSESDVLDSIDELLSKRIFVETHTASHVEFSHDLLRELVLADLAAARRRTIHRRIADVLEQLQATRSVSPSLLATHFLAGQMSAKAFEYSVKAGRDALQAYAFEDALVQLQQAEELQSEFTDNASQFQLYTMLSEAYSGASRMAEAHEACQKAFATASSPLEQGQTLARQGWFEQKQGKMLEAVETYDEALRILGAARPKHLPAILLSTQINLFYFHFVPLPILKLMRRKIYRDVELAAVLSEIYYNLAFILGSRNVVQYIHACARNVPLSRLHRQSAHSAFGLAKYALNLGFSGLHFLASRYARQSQGMAKDDARPEIQATAASSAAACDYFAGRLDEALHKLAPATDVLERCGDLHTSLAYHWLRHVYSVIGSSSEIIVASRKEIALAEVSGDVELVGYGLYGLCHGLALTGQVDDALAAGKSSIQRLTETDSSFCSIAYMEYGFALLQASRYDEAVEAFESALAVMRERLVYFEIQMPTYPRLTEAFIGPSWSQSDGSDSGKLKRAATCARRAKFFATIFPNIRPHTYRSLGRLHFARQQPRKARKCFDRAIAEAEKIGARYDLARALLDSSTAFPELAERKQQAFALLGELNAVIPQAELEVAEANSGNG